MGLGCPCLLFSWHWCSFCFQRLIASYNNLGDLDPVTSISEHPLALQIKWLWLREGCHHHVDCLAHLRKCLENLGRLAREPPSIHLLFLHMCSEHLLRAWPSAWHWGGRQPHHQVRHSSFFSWGTHSPIGEEATTEKIITMHFSKAHKEWNGGSKWQPKLSEKLSQRK